MKVPDTVIKDYYFLFFMVFNSIQIKFNHNNVYSNSMDLKSRNFLIFSVLHTLFMYVNLFLFGALQICRDW